MTCGAATYPEVTMFAAALLSVALLGQPTAAVVAEAPAPTAAVVTAAACASGPARAPDGVRRFWTTDTHCYASPWFAGRHRVMIWFGCTPAPYYPPAAGCRGGMGFHHGIDVDMPRGTAVRSAVYGTVVKGTLGAEKARLLSEVRRAIDTPDSARLRQPWQRGL